MVLSVVVYTGCTTAPPSDKTAAPSGKPETLLPGPTVANESAAMMSRALKRLHNKVFEENTCTQPEIYNIMPLKAVPWKTVNNTVELQGPVFERWRVLACGTYLEFYLLFRPSDVLKEGFVVGISYRNTKPFEIDQTL